MANLSTIVALMNAAKRRRTPRMVRVDVDNSPNGSLSVLFDRVMDNVPLGGTTGTDVRCIFALFDGVNGDIIQFGTSPSSQAGWSNERELSMSEISRTSGYTGPTYCRYIKGNIKGRDRYNLDAYSRCDRVEFI